MRTVAYLGSILLMGNVAVAQEPEAVLADSGEVAPSDTIPDVVGHLGFGYFTTTAPIGVRYWFSEKMGVDAGLGLNIRKPAVAEGTDRDTDIALGLEVGYLHSLAKSRNLHLFARPGLGLRQASVAGVSDFDVTLNGSLAGEMFLTALGWPNVSLTAGLGVNVAIDKPEDNDTGFGFSFYNTGANIVTSSAVIGVHFYL